MKEIIDLILASIVFISLLFPMFYYTVKETEEAREFVKEYYTQYTARKVRTKCKTLNFLNQNHY